MQRLLDVKGPHPADAARPGPRVLVVLDTSAGWSRGILKGFTTTAHARGWTLLHYHPPVDVDWLARQWAPAAAVVGPGLECSSLARLPHGSVVSVTVDRSDRGMASVCLDEDHVAALAASHLLEKGLRNLSTFRFDEARFAIARERAFEERARAAGARVLAGWGGAGVRPEDRVEQPAAMLEWLRGLPKPCGIFTCTDSWGRVVARYARVAGLRVPEDVALVGADDDVLECELISPPLSSVVIPWQEVGSRAASLVQNALSERSIAGERPVVSPLAVRARRSSDVFAIADPLVAQAVRWIRANAARRLTVEMVARAVGGGRQRLERRFRSCLDRTVYDEIRRAHVELARGLLETTTNNLVEVAQHSGFSTAALLSVAFQRELGMPPGLYRRRMRRELERAGDG